MQLLFKRNKIFMNGNQRYVGTLGQDGKAPLWIRDTDTFKMGIKDGSILDLRAEAAREEAESGEPEPEEVVVADVQPKIPAGNIVPSTGKRKG